MRNRICVGKMFVNCFYTFLGNIGVVKTYLGEVTDSTNQTRAFSYFSLMSGIASIST